MNAFLDAIALLAFCERLMAIGLVMDIVGIVFLFFCTSTKKIEAELSYNIVKSVTDEAQGREWLSSISYPEHQSQVASLGRRIRRNRRWAQFGIVLILIGFIFQLFASLDFCSGVVPVLDRPACISLREGA